jgi:hypothetical protein
MGVYDDDIWREEREELNARIAELKAAVERWRQTAVKWENQRIECSRENARLEAFKIEVEKRLASLFGEPWTPATSVGPLIDRVAAALTREAGNE